MQILHTLIDKALPASFDPAQFFLVTFIAIASILILSGIFRLGFGKGSTLNSAISSSISILCIYVFSMVVFSFSSELKLLFAPLPFVTISGGYLRFFPIFNATFTLISTELLNLLIWAFLVNLLETWLPKGEKLFSWFFFRFFAIAMSICLHYFVEMLLLAVLPTNVSTLAPVILISLVGVTFLFGCLKMLVGGALAFINPFLGLFYTFFFSNAVGKQLKKAIVTTLLLTLLVCAFNFFGFTSICVASLAYLPYTIIFIFGLVLWYVISKFL